MVFGGIWRCGEASALDGAQIPKSSLTEILSFSAILCIFLRKVWGAKVS